MSFDVFPDNKNRKARLSELLNDVNIYFNDASQDVETIRQRTETISTELHDMYLKLSLPPPPISEFPVTFVLDDTGSQTTLFVFKGITALVGMMATQRAVSVQLERAAVNYLVRAGEIGAAAFSRVAGLPLWLRVGQTVGSTGVAIIVTLGIELIFDSIAGSEIRDNLRRGINDEVPLRAKVYKTRKMNAYLKEDLLAFITSLGIMQQLGYTQQQLEQVQQLHIAEIIKRANEIYTNDNLIMDGLNQLDNGRDSWRHEDPSVPLPISLIKDSIRNGEALPEIILEKIARLKENNLPNILLDKLFDFAIEKAAFMMKSSPEITLYPIVQQYLFQIAQKVCLERPTPIIIEKNHAKPEKIESLWNDKKTSDISIIIGQKEFHCHKTILSSSSPYFEALFSSGFTFSDLKDSTYTIDCTEFEEELHETIIKYCYNLFGEYTVSNYKIIPLFKCASFYEITEVTNFCVDNILITTGNFFELVQQLENHQCESLVKKLVEFGMANIKSMKLTKEKLLSLPEFIMKELFWRFAEELMK